MRISYIITAVLLLATLLQAGVFDSRYPSARATGMSDAYVAVANDVWASYYNPAGLAAVTSYQVATAVQRPFNQAFFTDAFLAASAPLPGKFGTVSVAFENYGVSYKGQSLSSEITATVSHGFYLLKDMHTSLSFGYNLKYYHLSLGESTGGIDLGSAGTFGLDAGLQASLYERTFVGVYVYNLNAPVLGADVKHDLPQRLVIGAAYRPVSNLITSLSFDKTVGFNMEIHGGLEYLPVHWLALRVGASTEPNRFSAGFGINYNGIHLDYSFNNHPVLPETHKFGLTYEFNL